MADKIDQVGSLGADRVAGITHNDLMKADPVWAQLRGEIAALQSLVKAQKSAMNALLAQLDTEGGLGGGYVAAHAISLPDPDL